MYILGVVMTNVVQKMDELDRILDEYEVKHGIKDFKCEDIDPYLSLTRNELSKMSASDCGEVAFLIERTSLYIQKLINKETARINWAETSMEFLIADKLNNYGGQYATYQEKKNAAIKDNSVCCKYMNVKVNAQKVVDRMAYLPQRLNSLAKTLESLQQSKRRA